MIVAVVIVATLAHALAGAPPLDEDPHVREAKALYDALAYERAVTAFEAALADPRRTPEERARVHAFIGLVRAQMTDLDGARREFDLALHDDVCVLLPDDAPPKVAALLVEARARGRAGLMSPPVTPPAPAVRTEPAGPPDPGVSPGWMTLAAGGTLVAAGAVATGAGLGFGALATTSLQAATAAPFQDDALRGVAAARQQAVVATTLLWVGVPVLAAGVAVGCTGVAVVLLGTPDDPPAGAPPRPVTAPAGSPRPAPPGGPAR